MTTPDTTPSPILALTPAHVQRSADGGWRNMLYGDVYFQAGQAIDESLFVFLEKNDLPARLDAVWQAAAAGTSGLSFTVAELGFGTGLNMMLVHRLWNDTAARHPALPDHLRPRLFLVSIEKHPILKSDLAELHRAWPELAAQSAALLAHYPPPVRGFHTLHLQDTVSLLLCLGDVADMLPALDLSADTWFLDGFAPSKNAEMWQDSLYAELWRTSADGARISTFTAVGYVRRGLKAAGFNARKIKGYGIKYAMIVGYKDGTRTHAPLPRVAVIGAGLAGAATARALAERGCAVTVFERHDAPAQEASGNPVGILYPKPTVDDTPRGQLATLGFLYTQQVLARLCPDAFYPCGVLRLDMNETSVQRGNKLVAAHAFPAGFCDWLPQTAFGHSGLWHAEGGAVAPAAMCRALLDHPRVTLHTGQNIETIPCDGFDITVLATANAARHHDATLPLTPLRGQMLTLRATASSAILTHVVCHEGYVTPAIDGYHYAGATFQKEGPANPHDHRGTIRDQDNEDIVADLAQALPLLGVTIEDVVAARAAYRATTPDKMPIVGKLDGQENVYVIAGFGAHAVAAAPLCGALLTAHICGDPVPVTRHLRDALSPARFAARAARRNRTTSP